MKHPIEKYPIGYALLVVAAVATIGVQHLLAQEAAAELPGYYLTIPWTEVPLPTRWPSPRRVARFRWSRTALPQAKTVILTPESSRRGF